MWCKMSGVRRRRRRRRAGGGCGAAGAERRTGTPHGDVGNKKLLGRTLLGVLLLGVLLALLLGTKNC